MFVVSAVMITLRHVFFLISIMVLGLLVLLHILEQLKCIKLTVLLTFLVLLEMYLIYQKLLIEFCMSVFFPNSSYKEFLARCLTVFFSFCMGIFPNIFLHYSKHQWYLWIGCLSLTMGRMNSGLSDNFFLNSFEFLSDLCTILHFAIIVFCRN